MNKVVVTGISPNGNKVTVTAGKGFEVPYPVPGEAVELRTNATHIQWKYENDVNWIDLVALADLKGEDGQEVSLQTNATHIQWRLGNGTWTDLIDLDSLKGEKGDKGDKGDQGIQGDKGDSIQYTSGTTPPNNADGEPDGSIYYKIL